MASIELIRDAGVRADRRRAYRVMVDRKKVGKIRKGETKVFDTEPGHHELQLRIDWGSSERIEFDVAESESAVFSCRPRIAADDSSVAGLLKVAPKAIYQTTLGRRRYIDLRREA